MDILFGNFCGLRIPARMQLVYERGTTPRFPFEVFRQQVRTNGDTYRSLEDLRSSATAAYQGGDTGATVLGRIDRATSKDLLEWDGELYAVGYGGDVLFCLSGGVVVV